MAVGQWLSDNFDIILSKPDYQKVFFLIIRISVFQRYEVSLWLNFNNTRFFMELLRSYILNINFCLLANQ